MPPYPSPAVNEIPAGPILLFNALPEIRAIKIDILRTYKMTFAELFCSPDIEDRARRFLLLCEETITLLRGEFPA